MGGGYGDLRADDVTCRNRIYRCMGCGFIGREKEADEHQVKCDNPMELLK